MSIAVESKLLHRYFNTLSIPITIVNTVTPPAATIFVIFDRASGATNVIISRAKIIRVASSAKAYVLWKVIVNGFAVAVTSRARYPKVMVARVVACGMGIVDRRPALCSMTNITFLSGNKMSPRLSSRCIAIVA